MNQRSVLNSRQSFRELYVQVRTWCSYLFWLKLLLLWIWMPSHAKFLDSHTFHELIPFVTFISNFSPLSPPRPILPHWATWLYLHPTMRTLHVRSPSGETNPIGYMYVALQFILLLKRIPLSHIFQYVVLRPKSILPVMKIISNL